MARKESSLNPDQKFQKIMYVTVVWKITKEHHFSITASLKTSHPHNLPPSQLLILTTSHPHNLPPSQPPILTTSHPHNFPPSQPPPTLPSCSERPTLLEYISYTFNFHSFLAGPSITIQEHLQFMDGSNFKTLKKPDTSAKVSLSS